MNSHNMNIPSNAYGGSGSIEHIEPIFNQAHVSNAIVFTDKGVSGSSFFSEIIEKVENTKVI